MRSLRGNLEYDEVVDRSKSGEKNVTFSMESDVSKYYLFKSGTYGE